MRFLGSASCLLALSMPAWAATPQAARGSYRLTIFLPESDGTDDPSTEDWTSAMEAEVVDQLLGSCLFWAESAPDDAHLSCDVRFYHASDLPTKFEPIIHPSGAPLLGFWGGDEDKWINEMMDVVGYSSTLLYYYYEVEDFNDAAAASAGTEGAYSAFVANSLVDADGSFSDGSNAYAPVVNAPYLVMTWDNGRWRAVLGPESLREVGSHETGHLFGAEDEYAASHSTCEGSGRNGYANENHESCAGGAKTSCLMRGDSPCGSLYPYPICYWTRGMVGWGTQCAPTGVCGTEGARACASRRMCVDASAFCDGAADCADQSDERGCNGCDPAWYGCPDRSCAPTWALCSCPDGDGDAFRPKTCGGSDCNDQEGSIHPGVPEVCNTVDDDCNGVIDDGFDVDRDGVASCAGDCDDNQAARHLGAVEVCGNAVDEDCDGMDVPCDPPDAGGLLDAEVVLDAGVFVADSGVGDVGRSAPSKVESGCSCRASGEDRGLGILGLFLLGVGLSVRRRSCLASGVPRMLGEGPAMTSRTDEGHQAQVHRGH